MSRKRGGTSGKTVVPTGGEPVAAPKRSASAVVLIFEGGKTNLRRAEELVQGLGYRALAVDDPEEAERIVQSGAAPDLALVGLPGGEALARSFKNRGEDRASLILAVSGSSEEALEACETLGADAFVIRPYKRDGLASALCSSEALRRERSRAVGLAAELAAERARLLRFGEVDPSTGFHHFEFFKRLLVIELKRAKRYGYSLAACLVAVEQGTPADVARALRAVIRDIDLPVDYADGRYLVFLPYTDLAGAERVGHRLEAAVRHSGAAVSVGIAALKEGKGVSFAKLIKDASMALRAAQLKGGSRVVVKT